MILLALVYFKVQLYSHSGDVLSRKGICGVADEQACLTHSTRESREEEQTEIHTWSLQLNQRGDNSYPMTLHYSPLLTGWLAQTGNSDQTVIKLKKVWDYWELQAFT